ncbi:MAG TPA: hypothetical protein VHB97_13510 [Polyangia bacterium]|nr:hypothetical protein [Polyangia bacterium]
MRGFGVACAIALGISGCGADPVTPDDLSAVSDLSGATLTLTAGGTTRALSAWYSFYVQPLNDDGPPGTYLVVTAIDPKFDCTTPAAGLDTLSFLFHDRGAGATSTEVSARRGPDLDGTLGGSGTATLTVDDDQYVGYDLDGGVVMAGAGMVDGSLHFAVDAVTIDGTFAAPHCHALDFIVPD